MDRWTVIREQIATIVAQSEEPFEPETIQNAYDFVALTQTHCPPPAGIGKGYRPTFCIWWNDVDFEIAADRIEFYRSGEGHTDIHEHLRSPGEPFPEGLIIDLPSSAGSS
ncbi:hypothetical protein [Mesorhizobium sp. M0633]|uniref:hypothetical protein n=1 Tax=Mesorhizobium sp. M0633 TaxID=2956977 RepID=UPI00333D5D60